MPDSNSAALMAQIDRLPKGWRALVHEYGFKAVMALREDGLSLADADDALWLQRSVAQAQWLSTQYVHGKSMAEKMERYL
jgi:hypothetical protein